MQKEHWKRNARGHLTTLYPLERHSSGNFMFSIVAASKRALAENLVALSELRHMDTTLKVHPSDQFCLCAVSKNTVSLP